MKVTPLAIEEVLLVEPRVFGDRRGYFLETWSEGRYAEAGIAARFVQDNLSSSARGTLRGLHLQNPFGQAKLVSVAAGEVFDVAVDVRLGSPTFGRWVGTLLSAESHLQLYVPAGFAHGFCVTSEVAVFTYKCSEVYHPEAEIAVAWDDPEIGVEWPVADPVLSEKDRASPRLADLASVAGRLPAYRPRR